MALLDPKHRAALIALVGSFIVISSIESLRDRAIAIFMTAAGLVLLALIVAGRSLLAIERETSSGHDRGETITIMTIAAGLAIVAITVAWRAAAESIPWGVQLIGVFSGTCLLYASFAGVVSAAARGRLRR